MIGATGGSLGSIGEQQITIEDNDDAPSVFFDSRSKLISEDSGIITLVATLDRVSGQDVIVPLAFGGSATRSDDYRTAATQIVIPAGSLNGSIDLTVSDDQLREDAETRSEERGEGKECRSRWSPYH